MLPESPMKIEAGLKLQNMNARHDPNIDIEIKAPKQSSFIIKIIEKNIEEIIDIPVASPSIPSNKLKALHAPTM